jgi:hypothetical protein
MKRQYGVSLEEDAVLDRYDLATEAEMMSSLTDQWGKHHAHCDDKAKRAKVRMKLIEAEKLLFIRENPPLDSKGVPVKLTESMVDALVITNPEVQDATNEWLDAEAELGLSTSAVNTMREKSDKIRVLKELLLGGIYNLKD